MIQFNYMKKYILLTVVLLFAVFGVYIGGSLMKQDPLTQPGSGSPLIENIKKTLTGERNDTKTFSVPPFDKPIALPPGFKMYVYAEVPNARSLALGEDGTVFVSNRSGSNVYAIPDKNGDGAADSVITVARGLKQPNGIAVKDNALFIADNTKVLKYENISNTLDNPVSKTIYEGFISDTHHQWKYAGFGPDGKLYITLGVPCNVCKPDEPYGSIVRMNDDGSGMEVVARGIRNSVGFAWHPGTDELWFTDNGRDLMGDNIPPDELNKVTAAGQHFGFPYCHGTSVRDPDYGAEKPCSEFTPPVLNLDPHAAALGMKFYEGDMFPKEYKNTIFIAQHGSWNRSEKIGYRILAVKQMGSSYSVNPFAEGWLRPDGSVIGRPVDVLEMKDGSLLISDDAEGLVYRVVYQP